MLNDLNFTPDDIVFLQELAKELREQDNRIAAEPLFCVQTKRFVYGLDSEYADDYEYYDEDNCESYSEDELIDILEERKQEAIENGTYDKYSDEFELNPYDDPPAPFRRVYYKDYYETVTVHFTEKAADHYMRTNSHNLNEPRVYVTSQDRAYEWNRLREILLKL